LLGNIIAAAGPTKMFGVGVLEQLILVSQLQLRCANRSELRHGGGQNLAISTTGSE
jgi:hypothetical protein